MKDDILKSTEFDRKWNTKQWAQESRKDTPPTTCGECGSVKFWIYRPRDEWETWAQCVGCQSRYLVHRG